MNSFTLCTCSLFLVSKSTWRSRHWRSWSSRMRYISTAWQGVKKMEIEDSYKILFMSVRHYHLPSKAITAVPAADIDTIVFLCYFLIVALGDFLPHCTGWILTQLIVILTKKYFGARLWSKMVHHQKDSTASVLHVLKVYTHKSCPVLSLQYCGCWHQRT